MAVFRFRCRTSMSLDMEKCMTVFSEGFINEHFSDTVLPDTLSGVDIRQFEVIQQKCEEHMLTLDKLAYLVKDLLEIPMSPTHDKESVKELVSQPIFNQYTKTIMPLQSLRLEIYEVKQKFNVYERSKIKEHLLKAMKQVDQLKQALGEKKKDLAFFKKFSREEKGRGKKYDKKTRKEMKEMENLVKIAQAELDSTQVHVEDMKKKAGDISKLPDESRWGRTLPENYNQYSRLTETLLKEIKKIQDTFANLMVAKNLATVCITQKDLKKEKNKCPICLGDYSVGKNVKECKYCNQYFDEECMGRWLKKKSTCPLCRQSPFNVSK